MFSVGFGMARRSGFSSFLAPQLLEDGYSAIPSTGEPGVSSPERVEFVENPAVESIRAFFNDAEAELISISLRPVYVVVNAVRDEVVVYQPGQQ